MVIKCPNCDGALEYNVEEGKMYCRFCNAFFSAEQISVPQPKMQQPVQPQQSQSGWGQMPTGANPNQPANMGQSSPTGGFCEPAGSEPVTDVYGRNGQILYDMPTEERQARKAAFYAEQRRLSEEYQKRKEQGVDYTKAYAGTSFSDMSEEEREAAREEQRQAAIEENQKAFFGTGETKKKRGMFDGPMGPPMGPPMARKNFIRARGRVINNLSCLLTTDEPKEDGEAVMDNQIYTCKSCGAELCLSGVETSTFCIYCGQPTIVFDRMEKVRMPDTIIPFVVTKEEALEKIRTKVKKGLFIPSAMKNFEPERVCGIYIPYWLFDADYSDEMVIRSKVKSGKTTVTKYYRRFPSCKLYYFPVDASKNLNDLSSQKLEPYDYSGMRPFNPAYMSGFYSDRFDMSADQMMITSMFRAQSKMYDYVKKTVPGSPQGISDSYPRFHVRKKYYTMLPAWFMTVKYGFIPYTITVNGQTGKVVGAVPYSKKKFYAFMSGLFVGINLLSIPLGIGFAKAFFYSSAKDSGKLMIFILACIVTLFLVGYGNIQKYKKSMDLSSEDKMTGFVKGRQEIE